MAMSTQPEATLPFSGTFLRELSPAGQETLQRAGTARRYRTAAVLFHQGDPSEHVVVIRAGWCKITLNGRHGSEALLAIRGPGDIVGELSAIDGRPRMATVTALTPVTATVLSAERLEQCLDDDWTIARALLRHLAANLRESDWRRAQHGASNGDSRVIGLLQELVDRNGVRTGEGILIDLPLSQKDLADAVAASREVVARTMRVLRSRQIVVTRRRQIVVLRPGLLRSLAHSVSISTDDR
jgi:CRP-like cAMP-binding protein